jgi:hypothetical protein
MGLVEDSVKAFTGAVVEPYVFSNDLSQERIQGMCVSADAGVGLMVINEENFQS